MVTIRLARKGARNQPTYRVVVIEHKRKRGGKPIEVLGYWFPNKKAKKIDKKRWEYWIDRGAKLSASVKHLS